MTNFPFPIKKKYKNQTSRGHFGNKTSPRAFTNSEHNAVIFTTPIELRGGGFWSAFTVKRGKYYLLQSIGPGGSCLCPGPLSLMSGLSEGWTEVFSGVVDVDGQVVFSYFPTRLKTVDSEMESVHRPIIHSNVLEEETGARG